MTNWPRINNTGASNVKTALRRKFEEWSFGSFVKTAGPSINTHFLENHKNSEKFKSNPNELSNLLIDKIESSTGSIIIDLGNSDIYNFDVEIIAKEKEIIDLIEKDHAMIHSLSINNFPVNIILRNLSINHITVSNSRDGIIRIESCIIRRILIHKDAKSRIIISKSMIANLQFEQDSISFLSICKSFLGRIYCAPPNQPNPFNGDIILDDETQYADDPKSRFFHGAQPFRNIRYHVSQLHNFQTAERLRRLILKIERASDRRVDRALNVLYNFTSIYGTSWIRPLFLSYIIFLSTVLITFISENIYEIYFCTVSVDKCVIFKTWAIFLDYFKKPVLLALQSFTNPFSLFSIRRLYAPDFVVTEFMLFLFSIIFDTLIILSILAIRRRFKKPQD